MTRLLTKTVAGLCLLLFAACAAESNQLKSPEQVAREWQDHLDNNRFEEARRLSTKNAKVIVDMIETIFQDEGGEESWISQTDFAEMNCREVRDSAICTCLIREEGELIRDSFLLIRTNGKWLVDIAEEDLEPLPSLDEIFEELDEMLEDTLETDTLIQ